MPYPALGNQEVFDKGMFVCRACVRPRHVAVGAVRSVAPLLTVPLPPPRHSRQRLPHAQTAAGAAGRLRGHDPLLGRLAAAAATGQRNHEHYAGQTRAGGDPFGSCFLLLCLLDLGLFLSFFPLVSSTDLLSSPHPLLQGISDAIEVAPVRQRRVSWSRMTPELKGNTAATNGTQRRGSLALASREDANSTPAPNPPQKARRRSGALTAPDMRRPSQVESVEETDADGGGSEYVTLAQQQQRNSGPAMYSAGHDTAMYVPPEQQRQQQQQQQQQVQSPGGAMYTPVAAQAGNGTLYTPVEAQGGVNGDMYTPVEAQGGQPAPELYDPVEATGFHGAIALHGPASRAQASAAAPGVIEFERPGGAAECRVSMMTDDCGGSQRQHSEAVDAQSPLSPSPSANNYGRYLSDKEMQELAASDGLARAASRDTLRTQLTETDL